MKKRLTRILLGAALAVAGFILRANRESLSFAVFLAAFLAVGSDIILKAAQNIIRGRVFDEYLLMSVATVGAFAIGEYPEGVAVMLFYQVGELFQWRAVGKSRKSIAELMDIRPDYANLRTDGGIVRADPDDVRAGDVIVIKAGERIPLDARVIEGRSAVDTAALTGESVPRDVFPGCDLVSGCINMNGLLTAEVTKEYGESTVSKILDLVENAAGKKARAESLITRFAKYYTPAVVFCAALISVLPPLLLTGASFGEWVYRGLTFLVISCPCALVVSVPLGFFGGIGGASRNGILMKGSNFLEALAKTEIVVLDKTGTLTKGTFTVSQIHAAGMESGEVLEAAAYAGSGSSHPVSLSLRQAFGRDMDAGRVANPEEMPGRGVRAVVDGRRVLAGNERLMAEHGVACHTGEAAGTVVHVAVDEVYAGYIVIADEIKEDSRRAVPELKKEGVRKIVMLTGDARQVAEKVAGELRMDAVYAALLPAGKVEKLEALLSEKSCKGKLAFVGDGINDAPVLARADIGIAMGGLGSDAALEAADVVIMTDEPSKVALAIRIAKRTLSIVKQNIFFSLGVKFGVLLLAAAGLVSMWAGVAADVGVTVLAVLNAVRGQRVKGQ